MQIDCMAKEIFSGAQGIVTALGMDGELAMHTIILCGEFQLVECGILESCSWRGESVEVFSDTADSYVAQS